MKVSNKQIAALANSSQNKKREALLKTEKAIATLIERKQKITIRSVAREAGVSVSYIYKYPELAYKIQTLREQQKYSFVKSDKARFNKTDKLNSLEKENLAIKQELESLKLCLNRNKKGDNSISKLQQEHLQLLKENKELKRELEYTKQKLQEAREFILGKGQSDTAQEVKAKTGEEIIQKVRKIKQM